MELKLSENLKKKAVATALAMKPEDDEKNIPGTPFSVSRDKAASGTFVGKIEVQEEDFFIFQEM